MKLNKNVVSHKPVPHGGIYSIKNPTSGLIDFSSNINPLGFSSLVSRQIKKKLGTISQYPDSDAVMLKKSLSWYTKIPANNIVVGNGATEIIYNFCHAFLNKKTSVLIPIPTFGEYEAAVKLFGANILFFKTMNLQNDLNNFLIKIPKNGCVFICNPNNPTGILLSKGKLLDIIKNAKKKSTIVFVDESFIELVPDSDQSVIASIKKYDNLFVLRSMTKSFGLAGIRVGYAISSKKIISTLNKLKNPWNVSGLAQYAAGAALCHAFYLQKARKLIKKESQFLRNSISKLDGFECHDAAANFILIKTKQKSKNLQKKLLRKKILIRDCSTFRGLDFNYIRIAVKTRKQNQILVKALENLK